MIDKSKRDFCKRYFLQQVGDIITGFQEGMQEAEQEAEFDRYFDSYESSYALTLAYPDDILMETARRHGIETKGREKNDIVKELFRKHGGGEYRF
jgi:hypothetical protein